MRLAGVLTLLILALAATPAAAAPYSSVAPSARPAPASSASRRPSPTTTPGSPTPAPARRRARTSTSPTSTRSWSRSSRARGVRAPVGGFGTRRRALGNASGDTVGGIGGLAVDAQGRVYVLDSYNDRIRQFTPGGTFVRSFGLAGTAPGQFQLGINGGIAIHGSSLFVADQNNHRVQRFALDASGAPTGTPLAFGSFGYRRRAARPPAGAESSRAPSTSPTTATTASSGSPTTGPTSGSSGRAGPAARSSTSSTTRASTAAAVSTWPTTTTTACRFEAATFHYHRRWGLLGTEIGRFGYPRSLAGVKGDPAGGVYVGNTSNNRVDQFAPDATHRGSFGTNGRGNGVFMQPKSAAVGKDGALWVADTFSDRVQKLTAAGEPLASHNRVGTFGPAPGGDPGEFRNPYGVAIDPASGAVYVADTGNDRIQRFDGTSWTVVAGTTFNAPRGVWSTARAACSWPTPATTACCACRAPRGRPSARATRAPRPSRRPARASMSPTPATRACSSSMPPRVRCSAPWRAPGRAPARSASPRASRRTRGATCSSPTRATTACCASTPRRLHRLAGRQRHRRGPAHPAGPGHRRGR